MKLLLNLLVVGILIVTLAAPTGECFGCTAEAKTQCLSESLTDFNYCCALWGDQACATKCLNDFNAQLDFCYMIHGCPQAPRPY